MGVEVEKDTFFIFLVQLQSYGPPDISFLEIFPWNLVRLSQLVMAGEPYKRVCTSGDRALGSYFCSTFL